MRLSATAKTSVVSFIGFHKKTHLEGENYHADMILFENSLCIAVIVTLSTRTENEVGGLTSIILTP